MYVVDEDLGHREEEGSLGVGDLLVEGNDDGGVGVQGGDLLIDGYESDNDIGVEVQGDDLFLSLSFECFSFLVSFLLICTRSLQSSQGFAL